MNSIVLLILAVTAVAVNAGCGKYPSGHTMCLRAKSCSGSFGGICGGISDADKQIVLDKHNEFRNKVASGQEKRGSPGPQPAGGDIYELTWNDELATIAQRWADQLKWEHDCGDCRKLADGSYAGQNLYISGSTRLSQTTSWANGITGWYDEVVYVDGRDITKSVPKKVVGHYTQVLWADSKQVGCGVYGGTRKCGSIINGWGGYYCAIYVCNYSPGGNYMGVPAYTSKKCGRKSTQYPYLCV